jgi:membrane associated rhomboid family serine protease
MLYEYALISVVIASGYWGYYFLRNPPNGTPVFGAMQLGAALASLCGLVWRDDHALAGLAGAVGLGAGTCLLVVGPLVRGLARRLAAAERVGAASRLLDIAEVLGPGSGVAEEKALLGAMKEIREGRVEQTVDALTAAKHGAPAEARRVIDERIAMLYLAAYRWSDAIAHAEAHLQPRTEPSASELAERARRSLSPAPGELPTPSLGSTMSLRDALGIAPPVWVELLGAYGRTGNLDQAARMMARLEDVCHGREDAALWLHRARTMFLALAGRPEAVRVLLHPRQARHMSAAARSYWVAVAHEHRGDRAAATAAYEKARGRARGRPRELIDQALARLGGGPSTAAAAVGPATLSSEASAVVSRIEDSPLPGPIRVARPQPPWATWGLTLALLGVAATISSAIGPSSDLGVLMRAGAMMRGQIDDGEWWRLVSCMFVHVGSVHLAVNALGMFFLGRVLEEMFGTARALAIYGGAGLAGAVASYLGSPVPVSAGASGAIFGVLGAVFIELTVHRDRYRMAWKRGMWGALAVVTLAQVGIGFLYPVIDQWAHGAGLLAGIAFGLVLSPSTRFAEVTRHAGRVLALAFVGLAIVAAVLVTRTSIADSLDGPRARFELGELAVTAPASWIAHGQLFDPDSLVILELGHARTASPAEQIATWITTTAHKNARDRDFDRVVTAPARAVALPDGWEGAELIASLEDPMGHTQEFRVIAVGKQFGHDMVFVLLYAPDTVVHAAPDFFAELIGSIAPR